MLDMMSNILDTTRSKMQIEVALGRVSTREFEVSAATDVGRQSRRRWTVTEGDGEPAVRNASSYWGTLAPHHWRLENNYLDVSSVRLILGDIRQPVMVVGAGQGADRRGAAASWAPMRRHRSERRDDGIRQVAKRPDPCSRECDRDEHDGEFFIFANLNTAGRTGHDYSNRWEGSQLRWYHKNRSHLGWPSVHRLIQRERRVHVFWRETNRAPFEYAGLATPWTIDNTTPVEVQWSFDIPNRPRPAGMGIYPCSQQARMIACGLPRSDRATWAPVDLDPGQRQIYRIVTMWDMTTNEREDEILLDPATATSRAVNQR